MKQNFGDQIKQFREKVDRQTTTAFQEGCRRISYAIAEDSPCSTGKLIGQWSPSVGTPVEHNFQGGQSAWYKSVEGWEKDEGIADTNRTHAMADLVPRIESTVMALDKESPYYFTNHTSYVRLAEYHGWKSVGGKQGPYFMVTKNAGQFKMMIDEIVATLK